MAHVELTLRVSALGLLRACGSILVALECAHTRRHSAAECRHVDCGAVAALVSAPIQVVCNRLHRLLEVGILYMDRRVVPAGQMFQRVKCGRRFAPAPLEDWAKVRAERAAHR
eukprot:7381020-Prymnesium_polylepis.3